MPDTAQLSALILVCSLKASPAPSSSDLLGRQVLTELDKHGVRGDVVRIVDHNVRFGVNTDEGNGDQWPAIRALVLAADILVVATPIWMGQPSSVCKMVLERLDAETSETDDQGQPILFGKTAGVAVVGNEDGAHHTSAEVFQSLNDVGFTLPAQAVTYWVGEAMHGIDYNDLDQTPEATAKTTATLAAHLAHAARLFKQSPYPN